MSSGQECRRCCVLGCPNGISPAKIGMHRIPDADPTTSGTCDSPEKPREELRSRWLRLAGVSETEITPDTSYVCARHFPPNAYQHIDTDQKKVRRLKGDAVPGMFLPGQQIESEGKKASVEGLLLEDSTTTEKSANDELVKTSEDKEDDGTPSPSAERSCQVIEDGGADEFATSDNSREPSCLSAGESSHESDKDINKATQSLTSSLAPLESKEDPIEPVEGIESETDTPKADDSINISPAPTEELCEAEFCEQPSDENSTTALDSKCLPDGTEAISNGHLNIEDAMVVDAVENSTSTVEICKKNGVGTSGLTKENTEGEETIQFAIINDDIEMDEEISESSSNKETKKGEDDEMKKDVTDCEEDLNHKNNSQVKSAKVMETDSEGSLKGVSAEKNDDTESEKASNAKDVDKCSLDDSKVKLGEDAKNINELPTSKKSAEGQAKTSELTVEKARRTLRSAAVKRVGESSPENSRQSKKMALDETRTQARMKYSPRKVDLAKGDSNSPSTSPPVLPSKRNVQALLNNYGDLIAQEIHQKLSSLGKAQTTIFQKMFEKIAGHALLIERLHRDVSCRLNSCKYANSVRHAAVQVTSVPPFATVQRVSGSGAPRAVQMAPPQTQGSTVPMPVASPVRQQQQQQQSQKPQGQVQQSPSTVSGIDRPVVAPAIPTITRGRPRLSQSANRHTTPILNAALQPRSPAPPSPVKTHVNSSAVIDLTDDEPVRVEPVSSTSRTAPVPTPRTPQVTWVPRKPVGVTGGAVPVGGIVPAGALRAVVPNAVTAHQSLRSPLVSVRAPAPAGGIVPARVRLTATNSARLPAAVIGPRSVMVSTAQALQRAAPPSPSKTTSSVSLGAQVTTSTKQSPQTATVALTTGTGSGSTATTTVQLPPDIVMRPVQPQATPVPQSNGGGNASQGRRSTQGRLKHPAPLPPTPTYMDQGTLSTPPAPIIQQIKRTPKGIVVTFDAKKQPGVRYADTEKYQVYSYVETNDPPSTSTWNKVGEVGSLRLPMACTFTQFKDGHRIFFAVRGVDTTGRLGSFNEPKAIDLRENVIIL